MASSSSAATSAAGLTRLELELSQLRLPCAAKPLPLLSSRAHRHARRRRRADPGLAADFLRAGPCPRRALVRAPDLPVPVPPRLARCARARRSPLHPNPEALRLKAEFLILLQPIADDPAVGAETRETLTRLLDLGVVRLKREVEGGGGEAGAGAEEAAVTEEDLRGLWGVFLDNALVFDALCVGVSRQIGLDGGFGADVLLLLRQNVQHAHLDAVKTLLAVDDLDGAAGHLRFLCLDHGVEKDEYK